MTTAQPSKFHFDLDLSGNQSQTRVMTETRIKELRQQAREEGYAEGLAKGEHTEVARAAAGLMVAGEKVAANAVEIMKAIDVADRRSRTDGIGLARAIGMKLAATLVAREPEVELGSLIEECLASLDRAPHLVVRCHPALCDKLKEITEAHMAAAGFNGRLIILGDPEIAPGDGRLEWADGGLVRNMGTMLAEIDKTIVAHCATSGLPEPLLEPSLSAEMNNERD
jgi:flagellar assembly protein FliH